MSTLVFGFFFKVVSIFIVLVHHGGLCHASASASTYKSLCEKGLVLTPEGCFGTLCNKASENPFCTSCPSLTRSTLFGKDLCRHDVFEQGPLAVLRLSSAQEAQCTDVPGLHETLAANHRSKLRTWWKAKRCSAAVHFGILYGMDEPSARMDVLATAAPTTSSRTSSRQLNTKREITPSKGKEPEREGEGQVPTSDGQFRPWTTRGAVDAADDDASHAAFDGTFPAISASIATARYSVGAPDCNAATSDRSQLWYGPTEAICSNNGDADYAYASCSAVCQICLSVRHFYRWSRARLQGLFPAGQEAAVRVALRYARGDAEDHHKRRCKGDSGPLRGRDYSWGSPWGLRRRYARQVSITRQLAFFPGRRSAVVADLHRAVHRTRESPPRSCGHHEGNMDGCQSRLGESSSRIGRDSGSLVRRRWRGRPSNDLCCQIDRDDARSSQFPCQFETGSRSSFCSRRGTQ